MNIDHVYRKRKDLEREARAVAIELIRNDDSLSHHCFDGLDGLGKISVNVDTEGELLNGYFTVRTVLTCGTGKIHDSINLLCEANNDSGQRDRNIKLLGHFLFKIACKYADWQEHRSPWPFEDGSAPLREEPEPQVASYGTW